MKRRHLLWLALSVLSCCLPACQDESKPSEPLARHSVGSDHASIDTVAPQVKTTAPAPQSATGPATGPFTLPSGRPIIAMWDGGVYLANIKPRVLLAWWQDGTFVHEVHGKLMIGHATPAHVELLAASIEKKGFFDPSLPDSLVHADGPQLAIAVGRGNGSVVRRYHGRDEWLKLNEIGPSANPSRNQVERFVLMWNEVVKLLNSLHVDELRPCPVPVDLAFPQ